MLIQLLAASNFLLGAYDAWLTQKRIKLFGKGFELNRLIKILTTHTGPETAAIIGVLGPVVGWTYILSYFNLTWALALLVGYNLKRFELQLSSAVFEAHAREIQTMLKKFRSADESTLHSSGELTPPADRSSSKEGK